MSTDALPVPPAAAMTAAADHPTHLTQELTAMLLHEALARARMREDQRRAAQARLAHHLVVSRRWRRLARFADQRARRAAARV